MKIGVCIKQVPPSDSRITVSDPAAGVDASVYSKMIINPYDDFALEEAVLLKDNGKAEKVIVFCLDNSDSAHKQILSALARGADEAIWIRGDEFNGSDCLGVSRALAAAIKQQGVDLVFCGRQAIDGDNSQLPSMLAELLDWNQATTVTKFELEGDDFKAWRDIGGGNKGVMAGKLPAVISCDKGLNEPRFVKLKERMQAKKKPLNKIGLSDLGLSPEQVGAQASLVEESNWELPSKRAECKIIDGDTQTVVGELIRLLREEAKVL